MGTDGICFVVGKKVGEQCGLFVPGTWHCTFVGLKLLFLFVNSAFVQRESDRIFNFKHHCRKEKENKVCESTTNAQKKNVIKDTQKSVEKKRN